MELLSDYSALPIASTQLLCSFDPNPRRKDCSSKTYLFPTCEFKRKSVQKDLEKRFVEAATFNRIIFTNIHTYFWCSIYAFFFKSNNIVLLIYFYSEDLHFSVFGRFFFDRHVVYLLEEDSKCRGIRIRSYLFFVIRLFCENNKNTEA